MRDEKTKTPGAAEGGSPIARFFKRLETTKVTVSTVLMFMLFLAAMSGLATIVGFVTHALARR